MKPVTVIAILLIITGIVLFSYQGLIWMSGQETVAQVGPLEVQRERDLPVPLTPILGGVAVAAGILLLATRGGRAGT